MNELERAAYMAGDTKTADLLDRVAELEARVAALEHEISDTMTLDDWSRRFGPAEAYRDFFFDCFERLGARYPAPSVTSNHDQAVIFGALEASAWPRS